MRGRAPQIVGGQLWLLLKSLPFRYSGAEGVSGGQREKGNPLRWELHLKP